MNNQPRGLLGIDPSVWNMGTAVRVAPPAPWWALPMNSQAARTELTRQLIGQCKIARVIETGTFLGTTTEFFATFGLPVITAEFNPKAAAQARQRLGKWTNVDLREGDSVEILRALLTEPLDRDVPTLFYLDAHWEERLPLREEAEIVLANFPKAVLLIDDFAVPDDPGYSFDDYGPGKRLDLQYLLSGKIPPVSVYFPSTPSSRENGARRGCVTVTADAGLSAILDTMPLLRRWKT